MWIEELSQFKSHYFCKWTYDNIYSCVNLLHTCCFFWCNFSVVIFVPLGQGDDDHILHPAPSFFQQPSMCTAPDLFKIAEQLWDVCRDSEIGRHTKRIRLLTSRLKEHCFWKEMLAPQIKFHSTPLSWCVEREISEMDISNLEQIKPDWKKLLPTLETTEN